VPDNAQIIKSFWRAVIDDSIERYNFEPFFKMFRAALQDKLARHGMLSIEEYIKCASEYYDLTVLRRFAYSSRYSGAHFSFDDVVRAIFQPRYEMFRSKARDDPVFKKLLSLYIRLQTAPTPDAGDNTRLADECIHAQHHSGNIIPLDITKLREEIETLSLDPVFGILTRPALELRLREAKYPISALLIDIDNLHHMNTVFGYDSMNKAIRDALIDPPSYISLIGRWFNGDEILIVSDQTLAASGKLEERFMVHDLWIKSHFINGATSFEDLKQQTDRVKWGNNDRDRL